MDHLILYLINSLRRLKKADTKGGKNINEFKEMDGGYERYL
ncbi:unnamed protein product [Acidithrix sp. C25]|nr:unnamed protein product [Acidithrix sp. C25]